MANFEQAISQLRQLLDRALPALYSMSNDVAGKGSSKDSWSAKQELGHLLDSAVVNHARIMRVLAEDNPNLSGYDGPYWVAVHNYQERDWNELVAIWEHLNEHLLMAAEGVQKDCQQRSCIFDGKPATLEFLLSDYVHHAADHLSHFSGLTKADLGVDEPVRAIA
jgi:hypothetical protein